LQSNPITLSDWVEQVIGGDLSLRGSTQYNYRRTLDRWIAPTVGRRPLKDIDASELRQFFGALLLGPAGKTAIYRLLSKAFRQAVNEGFVDGSPLAPIRRPHAGRKDVTPLTPEHVHALAEKVTPRYGLAILLAAYAGLRAGEVGGLRLQDIALDGSSLRIVQAVRREGGKRVLGDVKTTSGRRRVAIPTFLAEELRRHVQAFPRRCSSVNVTLASPASTSARNAEVYLPHKRFFGATRSHRRPPVRTRFVQRIGRKRRAVPRCSSDRPS
jgi:integrase